MTKSMQQEKKETEAIRILEILAEEIPSQCKLRSESIKYTKHLYHIAQRIVDLQEERITSVITERSNNEKTYMRIIKCLNEGTCKTGKMNEVSRKGDLEYIVKRRKIKGPYPKAKKLTIHTKVEIWEKEKR